MRALLHRAEVRMSVLRANVALVGGIFLALVLGALDGAANRLRRAPWT